MACALLGEVPCEVVIDVKQREIIENQPQPINNTGNQPITSKGNSKGNSDRGTEVKQFNRVEIEVKESDWCNVSSNGKLAKLSVANITDPDSKVHSVTLSLPIALSATVAELLIEMLSMKAFLGNEADKECLKALRKFVNSPDSKPNAVVEAEEQKLLSQYGYDSLPF